MFAIIGTLTATFTGRVIVIGHMTFTTAVITTLAILTWRRDARYRRPRPVGDRNVGHQRHPISVNGFTRGVQAALDNW